MDLPRIQNTEPGENVFLIAEIGKNFMQTQEDQPLETYIKNACELIDAAAEAGADAVKFQTHTVEDEQLNIPITSPHFKGQDRYQWVKRNTEATPMEFWDAIQKRCREKQILFFSTPMSRGAARKLLPLDPPFWKVGSGDVQDLLLMRELIRTKKPIIFSTGMVSYEELEDVVESIGSAVPLAILYCVSHYPCPPEHFNLRTIERMKSSFPHAVIGFSDHSLGNDAALAAVQVGARIIEKHFSLSRELWGSDHKVSSTPKEFSELVTSVRTREFEKMDATPFLGKFEAELEGATNPYRPYFSKRLVAGKTLEKGTILTEEDLYAMRPELGTEGYKASLLPKVLGKAVVKNLQTYDPITEDSLSHS
jgi:sialic acid synthase SpsE